MTDEAQVAPEATPEVVQPEAEQVEAAEAPESTEGQEQTPPAEAETPETPEEAEDKSPSKMRRERRKAHEAQLRADRDAAERELQAYKAREERIVSASQQTTPPKEADFQDYNEYLMAASAWQAGQQFDQRQLAEVQSDAKAKEAEIQRIQQQQQAEAQREWAAQVSDAKTRYADFDQVAFAPDVPITDGMARMLAASEHGADVAYQLGMNKALAGDIARMTPIEQAMAIGRLEASIQRPEPRTQSAAPEPITPVKAKADSVKKPEDMSPDEYAAWRNKGGTFKM